MILELCALKEEGELKHLFVMGCLSERYLSELKHEIPQVDKFYGKFNWKNLLADLSSRFDDSTASHRMLTTPPHYASRYPKAATAIAPTAPFPSSQGHT